METVCILMKQIVETFTILTQIDTYVSLLLNVFNVKTYDYFHNIQRLI